MQRYLETRTQIATSAAASSDLARHLLTRQHLGKTVVVTDKPLITMSVVRKYWLKLSRSLQRERASTLNAEKILQLTYDITHMQHMEFAARSFYENPYADVFFVTPSQLDQLPANCFNFYVVASLAEEQLRVALGQLPAQALVVDYSHDAATQTAPLVPKLQLEQQVSTGWRRVEDFLGAHGVDISQLADNANDATAIDSAIDVILNTSNQFLRVAEDFLELLRLAQPLSNTNAEQRRYDLLGILHRRVYELTPGTLSQQFTQAFSDDDLSLHDPATENMALALMV